MCSGKKTVLKICGKFTGEQLCQSAISIKLQSGFIEITLRHACSPVNLLHIFRTLDKDLSTLNILHVFGSVFVNLPELISS